MLHLLLAGGILISGSQATTIVLAHRTGASNGRGTIGVKVQIEHAGPPSVIRPSALTKRKKIDAHLFPATANGTSHRLR